MARVAGWCGKVLGGEMETPEEFPGGACVGDGSEGGPGDGIAVEVEALGDGLNLAGPVFNFDGAAALGIAQDTRDGKILRGQMGEEAVLFLQLVRGADEH